MNADRWKHLIFVVDDDPEHRRDVCGLLHDEGYRTIATSCGREAFGLLLTSSVEPSLIILDLVMDSVDGQEFRRRQLDHPRFASVPVIVVSGMPGADKVAAQLGTSFVAKPVNVDVLLAAIDGALGKETAQPAR